MRLFFAAGKKTGKKKNKPKALPLNEFLAAPIATSTAKEAPLPKRTQSWADESEHLESDGEQSADNAFSGGNGYWCCVAT